jgi:hypothetical protein
MNGSGVSYSRRNLIAIVLDWRFQEYAGQAIGMDGRASQRLRMGCAGREIRRVVVTSGRAIFKYNVKRVVYFRFGVE